MAGARKNAASVQVKSDTRSATSIGRRKQLNRSLPVLRFRKHRLFRDELRRLRNQTKPEPNAGVAGAAAVAAAARAAGLMHRSNLSQFRGAAQKSPAQLSRLPRFKHPKLVQLRAGVMRQFLLCCQASRFQSMAALPARKARGLHRHRQHHPARRAHSNLLRSSKRPSGGTAAACCRVNHFLCADGGRIRQRKPAMKRKVK